MSISEKEFIEYVKTLKNDISTTEFAYLYNMSAKTFNQLLANLNVHYKRKCNGKDIWILKRDFANKDLMTRSYTDYKNSYGEILRFKKPARWTKKGVLYIYYYLKKNKIEPVRLNKDDIEDKIEQLSFL